METIREETARYAESDRDASASSRFGASLAEEIDTLDSALGQLEDRLAYVLTPSKEGQGDRIRATRDGVSPLADRLASHAERVALMTGRVHELMMRLDLPA